MGDDVTVLEDETVACDDGTVTKVRILAIPESDRFPEGIKYAFHYGEAGADEPIIRFDNHHGPDELHITGQTFEIAFPGLQSLLRTWRAALSPEKRLDW